MLGGETTKSGLRVVPSSQKNDHWDYRIEKKHGIQKPVFDENNKNIKALLVPTKPGNAIIFSYDLLHGGVQTIEPLQSEFRIHFFRGIMKENTINI